jgi:hypothetical protein
MGHSPAPARSVGEGLVALIVLLAALPASALPAGPALAPVLDGISWGERSADLAQHFGARAIRLKHPIEFGDSYVDVALRDEPIAGYPYTVYYQMNRTGGGLKRIMLERERHGANPAVFRALIETLTRDYGPPGQSCALRPSPATGYQAAVERLWQEGGLSVRAVFRDTTLEAAGGCVRGGTGACGLAGHLYVQIAQGQAQCGQEGG